MSSSKPWSPHADLVVHHARIHTVDLPIEEIRRGRTDFATYDDGYVAVKDKTIIAVGPGDGGAWIGPDTDVIDAQGHVLLPGLVDSHMHAQFSGEGMLNIDLRDVPSAQAMFDQIARRAAATPAGQFIQGQYWNELLWENGPSPPATIWTRSLRSTRCSSCAPVSMWPA
jgi:predicted amidohydrolase YtcJ